jgi:hypothetical protein
MRYEGHEARSRQWRTPWPRHQRIALAAEYKARSGDRGHGLTARREDPTWRRVTVRSSQYLNNLIEQDVANPYAAIARAVDDCGRMRTDAYESDGPIQCRRS